MFDCVKAVANGKKPEQVLLAMKNAMPLTNENQTYLAMLAVLKSYTL